MICTPNSMKNYQSNFVTLLFDNAIACVNIDGQLIHCAVPETLHCRVSLSCVSGSSVCGDDRFSSV
jgi:hypothetical protein